MFLRGCTGRPSWIDFVFTLLFHDGFRGVELPERLNPFPFIDDTIAPDIDDFKHVPHDTEGWECFIGHLADLFDQLTELSERDEP